MKYALLKSGILLTTISLVSTITSAKPIYTIENLGTIGDSASNSFAYSLNESGQVIGDFFDNDGNRQGFVWDKRNGMQSLGNLGGPWSSAKGINNQGHIVGNAATGIENQQSGFIYKDGAITQILDLTPSQDGRIKSSNAENINDAGQISGSYSEIEFNQDFQSFQTVSGETFLKTGENLELSGRLSGDESDNSSVYHFGINALNENGDYTGLAYSTNQFEDNGGVREVFVKKQGEDIEGIGTLQGGRVGFGFGINDNGTVVGRSRVEDPKAGYHAFIYTDEMGMVDVNDVFGFEQSNLRNINNSNMAVGWGSNNYIAVDEDPIFAPFLFDVDNEQTFFLNDFLTADSDFVSLDFAYSLNENNDIVGYGTIKTGQQRAFLMSFQGDIPEPSSIALVLGSLLLLRIKRKS